MRCRVSSDQRWIARAAISSGWYELTERYAEQTGFDVARDCVHHRSVGQAWCDHVDSDSSWREFEGQRSAGSMHAGFGCHVGKTTFSGPGWRGTSHSG